MGRPREQPKFLVRARATCIHWTCPACGKMNSTHLPPGTFKLRCKSGNCHRIFMYGIKLYEMQGGGRIPFPPDFVVPDDEALDRVWLKALRDLQEPLPVAELADRPYRKGERLNQFIPAAADEEPAEPEKRSRHDGQMPHRD